MEFQTEVCFFVSLGSEKRRDSQQSNAFLDLLAKCKQGISNSFVTFGPTDGNGFDALNGNTTGNTTTGDFALFSNITGRNNTANGCSSAPEKHDRHSETGQLVRLALISNTTGNANTVTG
jgi:hypothetical protein